MKPGRAFRSEDIADAVYDHLDDRFQAALYSFLGKAQDDPSLQSVRGTLMEKHLKSALSKAGTMAQQVK